MARLGSRGVRTFEDQLKSDTPLGLASLYSADQSTLHGVATRHWKERINFEHFTHFCRWVLQLRD